MAVLTQWLLEPSYWRHHTKYIKNCTVILNNSVALKLKASEIFFFLRRIDYQENIWGNTHPSPTSFGACLIWQYFNLPKNNRYHTLKRPTNSHVFVLCL